MAEVILVVDLSQDHRLAEFPLYSVEVSSFQGEGTTHHMPASIYTLYLSVHTTL